VIHPTAYVHPGVILSMGVRVGPYAVIGTHAELRGVWGDDGQVTVGAGTVIRENVTIQGKVQIGADCYIMDGCHIAHDCVIGDRVTLSPKVAFAGHVTVDDDATVGMGALVHQRRTIGRGAMVGMGAVVTKDIGPFEMWYGNPARQHGMNDRKLAQIESECYD
jgi:UDP-N-acetylglucosamine acyltransferase